MLSRREFNWHQLQLDHESLLGSVVDLLFSVCIQREWHEVKAETVMRWGMGFGRSELVEIAPGAS